MGISTSELVRHAVRAYNPEVDTDAVQTLADELALVVKGTERMMDHEKRLIRIETMIELAQARGGPGPKRLS